MREWSGGVWEYWNVGFKLITPLLHHSSTPIFSSTFGTAGTFGTFGTFSF
jgi:hypothetical protein